MSWKDILKANVQARILRMLKGALNEMDGVSVDRVTSTKNGRTLKFYCTYDGADKGLKENVEFIVIRGNPAKKISDTVAIKGMQTNARKALAKKNVFIGEW